jgi:hypothetical protein
MTLYWDIGKRIVESQKEMGWVKSVVEQLAFDLRWDFPDVKGFSARNLWKIQAFYRMYSRNEQKLPQDVAESDGINLRQLVAEIEELPSVWIIQCKTKKGIIAEYSLRDMSKPIGVSEYKLTPKLPKELSGQLPNPRQLAGLLEEVEGDREDKKGKKMIKGVGDVA